MHCEPVFGFSVAIHAPCQPKLVSGWRLLGPGSSFASGIRHLGTPSCRPSRAEGASSARPPPVESAASGCASHASARDSRVPPNRELVVKARVGHAGLPRSAVGRAVRLSPTSGDLAIEADRRISAVWGASSWVTVILRRTAPSSLPCALARSLARARIEV